MFWFFGGRSNILQYCFVASVRCRTSDANLPVEESEVDDESALQLRIDNETEKLNQ